MTRLPVYGDARVCGALEITRAGLYVRFAARLTLPEDAPPVRLVAEGGGACVRLGVPVPEGGAFVLTRTLAASACPECFTRAWLERAGEAWRAFSGRIGRLRVEDGLTRTVGAAQEYAFAFDPARAGALTPLLPKLRTMERGGRLWLVFRAGGT